MASKEDTQGNIGKILNGEVHRDAIHIAVLPAIAHANLAPNADVGYKNGKSTSVSHIGKVDPFLDNMVAKGEQFYIFLYPNTITSLHHQWTHPKVPDEVMAPAEASMSESEAWMRKFAEEIGKGYQSLLDAATRYVDTGEWTHGGAENEGIGIPEEFWGHYENITGTKVPNDKRGSFYSCAC